MTCQKCNATTQETDKFCHQCGRPVNRTAPTTQREAVKKGAADIIAEGKVAAGEAFELGKKGIKTDMGKSVAACAVLGAAVAAPLPLVGPVLGGVVGGAIGFIRKL